MSVPLIKRTPGSPTQEEFQILSIGYEISRKGCVDITPAKIGRSNHAYDLKLSHAIPDDIIPLQPLIRLSLKVTQGHSR